MDRDTAGSNRVVPSAGDHFSHIRNDRCTRIPSIPSDNSNNPFRPNLSGGQRKTAPDTANLHRVHTMLREGKQADKLTRSNFHIETRDSAWMLQLSDSAAVRHF
jgi:hypothetical protein